MKKYKNLYQKLCSVEKLELAFQKAQKRKSKKKEVVEFRENIIKNLEQLRSELISNTYKPQPLTTFIIRDPKSRKIRKSYFRDRIVHHAIVNILEPIFEKRFIYDSYANRKGKGTLKAIKRFDVFKRKVSRNKTRTCYVFKADIRHYFDEVNHEILINIIKKKVNDEQLINLIKKVLKNHSEEVGMPLGNMTSQFFQNIYLNELDQFVKHELKAKYYIRYVDDFVILHHDKKVLEYQKEIINCFLKENLKIQLHETKSKILSLEKGINFLGFRNFYHYKLLRKANIRKMNNKIETEDYEELCEFLQGWIAYAKQGNTHNLKSKITKEVDNRFEGSISLSRIDYLARYAEV